jgi:hypothetical protein
MSREKPGSIALHISVLKEVDEGISVCEYGFYLLLFYTLFCLQLLIQMIDF